MLIVVMMGKSRLHPDPQQVKRSGRRDDADDVIGALDERRGLGTKPPQCLGQLRRGHLGVKPESSQRRAEFSPRVARLLFKTKDQLQDRVGGSGADPMS